MIPVKAARFAPLAALTKLLTHEQQFFTGVAPHETVIGPQICKFLPFVARHFLEHGFLAMHHFIMGNRQHEIFAKCVDQAKRDFIMMMAAVDGFTGKIGERVIHKAHVPLEAEPKAAFVNRGRNFWPGRGFFGNRDDARMAAINGFVHFAQEMH